MRTLFTKFSVVLMLGTLIALANEVAAQTSLGVKGGYAASTFRGKDAGDVDWKSGFAGGLFVNIAVFEAFAIQPELLFRQRGGTNRNETFNINQRINLSYIDVPVLFKLRLPIDETFYPHVYIGPQFSYNLMGEYEVEAFDAITVQRDLDVRKVDAGGVMGFGLDVKSDRFFITADFRYGLGGINIDNADEPFLLKNKDLSVLLGVGVNIGGR